MQFRLCAATRTSKRQGAISLLLAREVLLSVETGLQGVTRHIVRDSHGRVLTEKEVFPQSKKTASLTRGGQWSPFLFVAPIVYRHVVSIIKNHGANNRRNELRRVSSLHRQRTGNAAMQQIPLHGIQTEVSEETAVIVTGRISREQAIADRLIVPVPEELRQAAMFRVPVALSSSAWEACVEWAQADTEDALSPVLIAARDAITALATKAGCVSFTVWRAAMATGKSESVSLTAIVGPGDDRKPVLTFYLASEV